MGELLADFVLMEPGQARHLVDRAIRIALDRRAVCRPIFPNDAGVIEKSLRGKLQELKASLPGRST
jgi:hypothetical protein